MSIHKAFSKKQNLQTLYYFFTYIMQNYSLLYNSAFNFTLQRNVQYTVLLIDNFIQFVQTCFKFSIQCFRFLFSKISYMYACNNNQLTTNQFEQQKLLYFYSFFQPHLSNVVKTNQRKIFKTKRTHFYKIFGNKKVAFDSNFSDQNLSLQSNQIQGVKIHKLDQKLSRINKNCRRFEQNSSKIRKIQNLATKNGPKMLSNNLNCKYLKQINKQIISSQGNMQ
eukprot:TRINITY_DN4898_c1_g1_i15.p1 TRINITY_DN4898_c1_g1~~TRINITY_DN4898_c1_g1_i15.p1  ORF type:complete len:222 (+),score=-11.93 TRINITY_DN4898_c1_g1_i15:217-882(+)